MGFIPDYQKPGPGVQKGVKKRGIFFFFEILGRKLTRLIAANFLCGALSIIWLAFLYLITPVSGDFIERLAAGVDSKRDIAVFTFMLHSIFTTGVFVLWGCAPINAAYAYVTRCMTEETPVWLVSDGRDALRANLRQSVKLLLLDTLMLLLGIFAVRYYGLRYLQGGSGLMLALLILTSVILGVYTIMHFYIYQIMIKFDCTFGELIRNSVLCALSDLPFALLFLLLTAACVLLLHKPLHPLFAFIIMICAGMCITRFPMEFHAARLLKKIMKKQGKTAEGDTEEE